DKIIITAEIGINHNGNLETAKKMIDAAAACGVDAVKFQAFETSYMYSKRTPGFSHTEENLFSQIQGLEIKADWWPTLRKRARQHKLFFSASVFDSPTLKVIEKTGMDFVKIASGEIDNLEFLAEQTGLSDIFVISTGMAVLEEISEAVGFLRQKGIEKMILLECTSSYPAPPESVHLLNIDFLAGTFGLPTGFSDHTVGYHHAVAAAARGARFIEKHFTLDKTLSGPDHKISSDVKEMEALVKAVREIECSMKCNHKKTVSSFEKESKEIGRKSVIACKNINQGETVTRENTIIKRPGMGIKPGEARYLYGRRAMLDIKKDQWITWDMV
ncbi:MAG: N-acetylneuraminate synthase, partial [bacterium]|nr:N-acetylneuraminate synthase [bacterium]